MKAWWSTIRPLNLFLMAITMYLMRWCIVKPLLFQLSELLKKDIVTILQEGDFFLLVLSVVFIAAGGFVLNDTVDQAIDARNKPGKNKIGQEISEKAAWRGYYGFTFVGLLLSFYVALRYENHNLALLQTMGAVSLWFYSMYFKRSFLIGNLLVACTVAGVSFLVGVYEVYLLQTNYLDVVKEYRNFNFNFVAYWVLGFTVFAFLINLAREIIKDAEDEAGDRLVGARTLPIRLGLRVTKIVVVAIYALTAFLLVVVYQLFVSDRFTLMYAALLIILLAINGWWVIRAEGPAGFHKASSWNKVTAAVGLLYSFGVAYMMYNGVLL